MVERRQWVPWMIRALVLGGVLCVVQPSVARAEVMFQWAAQGGVRFQFKKSGLNYFLYPPDFHEDRIGASLLLGVIGLLRINSYLEFGFDLDMGEMFLGHLKRGSDEGFAVLLNDARLNLSDADNTLLQQQREFCLAQARRQGLPESECNNPSIVLLQSLFVRELFATISFSRQQWIKMDVGILHRKIGRAFVLDNYVLGLHFDANWFRRPLPQRKPYRLEFDFFLPDATFTNEGKSSPAFHLKGSYIFAEDYQVSFFGVYLWDGNNLAGKNLLPLWKELLPGFLNDYLAAQTGERTRFSCHALPSDNDLRLLRNAYPKASEAKAEDFILGYLEDACNKLPSSSGHHVWLGMEGRWKWRNRLTVAGSAILYLSSMTIGLPEGVRNFARQQSNITRRTSDTNLTPQQEEENPIDVPIQKARFFGVSFLGELQLSYHWTSALTTSAFFLFAMGDTLQQRKPTLHAFMGIAPQVRYTDVFFNGGINSYSARRGIGVSGISGQGYIAPGFTVQYTRVDQVDARFTTAAFWSVKPSVFPRMSGEVPGTFYGLEFNLIGAYHVTRWLRPVAQVDLFVPGNFFTPSLSPVVMFQVLVGLDFVWL